MVCIDVPHNTTPDEAAKLLDGPNQGDYYLHRIVEWPGVGVRAFFGLRIKPEDKPSGQALEARAVQFIRDNREMSVKELCAGLKALRYVRSQPWVAAKRAEIVAKERAIAAG